MLQIFLAMLETDEEKERFEQFYYKYRIWSDDSYVYIISGNVFRVSSAIGKGIK